MKILILEDEPIIAMDLEEIVQECTGADIIVAGTLEAGLRHVDSGLDFALLDLNLGNGGDTSLPVAEQLLRRGIDFCFVSSVRDPFREPFQAVPRIRKPYDPVEIMEILPLAA